MKTNWIRGLMIPGLLLASTATTQANDIVDFLNALNDGPRHEHGLPIVQPVGHHHDGGSGIYGPGYHGRGYNGRELTSRDAYKLQTTNPALVYGGHGHGLGHGHFNGQRFDRDERVNLRDNYPGPTDYGRPNYLRGSGAQLRFRVSANQEVAPGYDEPLYIPDSVPGQTLPPVQNYPAVPDALQIPALPHRIGEIVDCQVPLAGCVRIEDLGNIAPNAVPVIVAVRDPSTCAHECRERMAYVQILVPPCPPRSITISPCHSRVTMCFGQYDVDIKSRNGMIVVDYDN